ncbi:reverse transcriptase-like protein [Jeotgalibacillus soli]|nr:reverse transcriptase-like protein [Jeotgalibacillus soli]
MDVRLHFNYYHQALPSVAFSSDWIEGKYVLPYIKDLEKTGRMKDLVIEDNLGHSWTLKEFKKLTEKVKGEKTNVSIHFDGSFRLSDHKAGIGIVLTYDEDDMSYRIRENDQLEEINSNNEAEYAALYRSIQLCSELRIEHQLVKVTGDSLVVINQLNGEWPCYEPALQRWLDRIEEECRRNHIVLEGIAVKRNENKDADKLASQAVQGISIRSHNEM